MEEYREWRLVKLMRCTPSEVDEESAIRLDWLLAVDDTVARARANVERKAAGRG